MFTNHTINRYKIYFSALTIESLAKHLDDSLSLKSLSKQCLNDAVVNIDLKGKSFTTVFLSSEMSFKEVSLSRIGALLNDLESFYDVHISMIGLQLSKNPIQDIINQINNRLKAENRIL